MADTMVDFVAYVARQLVDRSGRGAGRAHGARRRDRASPPRCERRYRKGDRPPGPRHPSAAHDRARERDEARRAPPARDRGVTPGNALPEARWVRVGRIGRSHGVNGAVVVEDASEDPERFANGARVYVDRQPATVVESKRASGRPVIRLDRPVSRGALLELPAEELPALPEGELYAFQLEGLDVEDRGGRAARQGRTGDAGRRERRARARHAAFCCRSSRTASEPSSSTPAGSWSPPVSCRARFGMKTRRRGAMGGCDARTQGACVSGGYVRD